MIWKLLFQAAALLLKVTFFLLRQLVRLCLTILRGLLQLLISSASTTHGSARWATLWELFRSGSLRASGIIVGKIWGRFIRFQQEGFVLLFAPTRAGKGYSVVVPNLLDREGSIIVTDIKGENHAITARARAQRGPVWTLNVLDPSRSNSFNPLDMVQIGTMHESDDAKQLADLMIIPEQHGSDHWDEKARALLGTLILFVCHKYRDVAELRTLAQVRALAVQDWAGLAETLKEATELGPVSLREEAVAVLAMEKSDEYKSVKSTMDKATSLWSIDKPAGLVSSRSDFRFEQLNEAIASIYVMVPEEKLRIYRGFLRVMIGCAIVAMTRAKHAKPKVKTLLIVDEAAALGRLQPIEDGVGYLATYMSMVMVWQDLDQLERTYPKARSMIANAGCKVAFNVADIQTARMLADSIGHTTILSRSAGQSQANVDMVKHQMSEGVSETGRYLVDPSEIMRLPAKRSMILMPRQVRHPILATKVVYWKERRWKGKWDIWRESVQVPVSAPRPAGAA
ncbi:MAG: type IV secretory system conjugative DNA transfer family protein [Pseudomonadota bacterium]